MEAARIDGAGIIRTYTSVMLPLSLPGFVVVGIFQFTNIWNDFLFGVTILPSPRAQPITVALNNLSGSFSVDWNVVMAGAVVAALPTALVYIFLGRFFVKGLLAGSVKG
jgi:glucose/mannose transport system permease protein